MINEYVTLGTKSLCHHLTGRLDLFALVSLKVRVEVQSVQVLKAGWLPISFCTSPAMGPGHLQWASQSPATRVSAEGTPCTGQGVRLEWAWSSAPLAGCGALSKYKSWPISSHPWEYHCPFPSDSHGETALWHDLELPQTSVFRLKEWSLLCPVGMLFPTSK